jgi:hypothetical protein
MFYLVNFKKKNYFILLIIKMDFTMNTNLDGLYYRTSATPSLCGPYKTVTNYNGCSAAQGQKTQAFSRTDFKRDDEANAKMVSAADQSLYKQILQICSGIFILYIKIIILSYFKHNCLFLRDIGF